MARKGLWNSKSYIRLNEEGLLGSKEIGSIEGIVIESSSNNTLIGNDVRNNYGTWMYLWWETRYGWGIRIEYSSNNTLRNNRMSNNGDDFSIDGDELSHFIHDIDTSNLIIDGVTRRMYYLINQHDIIINSSTHPDLGFLALVNSTNITVQGLYLEDNDPGLLLAYTQNSTVTGNTVDYCSRGIELVHSSNNVITGNTIAPNQGGGIYLTNSFNNTISENQEGGISLINSSNNVISENQDGNIVLTNSFNNVISENNITNNEGGGICLDRSGNNRIIGNNITNNSVGIHIDYSSNNTLRNNRMSNNSVNFFVLAYFEAGLSYFLHDIDTSNLVDGEPIYYLINQHDIIIGSSIGFLALVNSTNVTVQGLDLQGMLLAYTNNSLITGNTVSNCVDGILLVHSSNNTLTGNNATRNGVGICLYYYSSNNTIIGNTATNNGDDGIHLEGHVNNNRISGNIVTNNRGGGIGLRVFVAFNNTIIGNTVTNNRMAGIELMGGNNTTIIGNTISNNGWSGIVLENSFNSTITGNNVTNNDGDGILLRYGSNNNVVTGNSIRNSTRDGISLDIWCNNTRIIGNNIFDSGGHGVSLDESSHNVISGNNIRNSTRDGIHLEGWGWGPWLYMSSNNTITKNNVTLSGDNGIYLYWASNNLIYHNNFINNTKQATSLESINTWDDGYPSGGNYWSDYIDVDLYSGPLQNEAGSDAIWDHPYVIDENNRDHYPLTNPWPPVICTVYFHTEPAGPGFSINFKGQTYLHGDANTFVNGTSGPAKANAPPGYAFDHWKPEGNVEVSNIMANPTTVTIKGDGNLTAVFREIVAVPDFTIKVEPTRGTVAQGESTNATVTLTSKDGYSEVVTLSASGQPPGVSVSFNPASEKPTYTSTMTINVGEDAKPNIYIITIIGTGADGKAHTTTYTLTVKAPPVGGKIAPVNKIELLAPWIGLGIGLGSIPGLVIATLLIRKRRRKA